MIQQNVFMPSWLGKLTLISQRSQWYDKPNAMPEERVQENLKTRAWGVTLESNARTVPVVSRYCDRSWTWPGRKRWTGSIPLPRTGKRVFSW